MDGVLFENIISILRNNNEEVNKRTYITLDDIENIFMESFLSFEIDGYEQNDVSVITHRFREDILERINSHIKNRNNDNPSCNECLGDRSECEKCIDNSIYNNIPRQSKYKYYKPMCKKKHMDCINDPGYINYFYQDKFKEIYGDATPEEVEECIDYFEEDEKCSNYKSISDKYRIWKD